MGLACDASRNDCVRQGQQVQAELGRETCRRLRVIGRWPRQAVLDLQEREHRVCYGPVRPLRRLQEVCNEDGHRREVQDLQRILCRLEATTQCLKCILHRSQVSCCRFYSWKTLTVSKDVNVGNAIPFFL